MRFGLLLCLLSIAAPVSAGEVQELSSKELSQAKRLYQSKCSRCHKFYSPSAYDDAAWQDWMEKMRKKSKLKSEQFELLTRYTETLRKDPRPAQPDQKPASKRKG